MPLNVCQCNFTPLSSSLVHLLVPACSYCLEAPAVVQCSGGLGASPLSHEVRSQTMPVLQQLQLLLHHIHTKPPSSAAGVRAAARLWRFCVVASPNAVIPAPLVQLGPRSEMAEF